MSGGPTPPPQPSNGSMHNTSASTSILSGASPFNISPLSLFLVQALIVICTARILAFGMKFLRQPIVMSEVIGGLILGGSALSRIPAFKDAVFPTSSLAGFNLIAQFGLMLYLFLIGLEVDPTHLIKLTRKSVPISLAGIALPFLMGVAVSKLLYDRFASPKVSFTSFFIFTGVAMSITAFPVLARILTERNLLPTKVGITTIAAAAVDDVMAWTLLVLVVALINTAGGTHATVHQYISALYVFLTVVATAIFLWFGVRPLLTKLIDQAKEREHLSGLAVFVCFVLALLFGWFTEIIGVHAIFGAFLVGCIIPHNHGFARKIASQMEDLITAVFLPLYFAYSGLNTRIDLLNTGEIWGYIILIITVACFGKVVGCTIVAKLMAHTWRESLAIGILMNTKGLVELIVLNIGLNAEVISPTVFSMFVVMAIVTTLMTVPLISVVYPQHAYVHELYPSEDTVARARDEEVRAATAQSSTTTNVLVCLPNLSTAQAVVAFIALFTRPSCPDVSIYGLRLIHFDERYTTMMKANEYDQITMSDIAITILSAFASIRNLKFHPLVSFTRDIAPSIAEVATHTNASLVIIPTKKKSIITNILNSIPSATTTLVQFIDHGFPNTTADTFTSNGWITAVTNRDANLTVRSTPATPHPRKTRTVVFVLDEMEAEASDTVDAANLVRLIMNDGATSDSAVALHVVIVYCELADVSALEDRKLPLISRLAARSQILIHPALVLDTINILAPFATDLVIVGQSVVDNIQKCCEVNHKVDSTLELWSHQGFNNVCGSVAIVNGRRSEFGKRFVLA